MKFNVTLLLLFTISILNAQVSSKEAKKWRADLQDLKQQLTERHVNLFHTVSKDSFELAVAHLDEKIPTLMPRACNNSGLGSSNGTAYVYSISLSAPIVLQILETASWMGVLSI